MLLFIMFSDNGGLPYLKGHYPTSAGSNYPLRAGKGTCFQGGVNVVGAVGGGKNVIPNNARGQSVDGPLMHVVDLFTTILSRTDAAPFIPANVDGVDLWHMLTQNRTQKIRDSIPLNINNKLGYPNSGHQRAILTHDGFKLIVQDISGTTLNYDGWYTANGTKTPAPHNETPGKFLFDLNSDPYERINIYTPNNKVRIAALEKMLSEYETDYQDPQSNWPHPLAFPWFHHGVWAPFWHLIGSK